MPIIHTDKAPKAIGPYSQGIRSGNTIYISGQLPLDPNTMDFPGDDITTQTRQSLINLQNIVESTGGTLKNVVKTTCFLASMDDFAAFNEVYTQFFGVDGAPARSCVEVARLPRNALVEVEAVVMME